MKYNKVKDTNRLEENKLTIWLNLELLRKKIQLSVRASRCENQCSNRLATLPSTTSFARIWNPESDFSKKKKKVKEMQNILLKWYNFSNTTNLPCIPSCLPALKPLLISVMKNFQNSKHKQINLAVYLLLCT